jgi:molecular chaperone HtpG
MVADYVRVESKAFGQEQAFVWESSGADGYSIETGTKSEAGTEITLKIKENTEDDSFEVYLTDYGIKEIVKKYSDFIKYPIKMDVEKSVLKEDSEDEYEKKIEETTLNNMVPIWKKRKNELTDDDYQNFYHEKRYGFDNPLMHIHVKADGLVRYNSIMYIPESMPFDYYSKEYEKGLELYANGVLIMNKCADLLPDYFSFVKGMVDSEDLSLNISREMLQHDRQLKVIAKNLKSKIKKELESMLKDDREKYEAFFKVFGTQIKYGVYDNYGQEKETLKDLLLFASSDEFKLVTLKEYFEAMDASQDFIYYATGDSLDKIDKMPQTEMLKDKDYKILYLTDQVDEFAIKMLKEYEGKEFKSVSSSDLGFEEDTEKIEENKTMLEHMKDYLGDKVADVKISSKLKSHPVCITNEGELSVEMEKILSQMPNSMDVKASKVLEVNPDHEVFSALQNAYDQDDEKFRLYTELLYSQALLIEGLSVNDPLEFSNNICKIMK